MKVTAYMYYNKSCNTVEMYFEKLNDKNFVLVDKKKGKIVNLISITEELRNHFIMDEKGDNINE